MLIAIMSDTFDRVTEVREQSGLREKIDILADFVHVIPRGQQSISKDKVLFAITPVLTSTDEQASWEGTVTALRRNIHASKDELSVVFNKKIREIQTDISNVSRGIGALEQRINEQQSADQRWNSGISSQLSAIEKRLGEIASRPIEADGLPGGDEDALPDPDAAMD